MIHLRIPIQNKDGSSAWPSCWPLDRIEECRRELGPRAAARVLDCIPIDDGACVFSESLVKAMVSDGLALPTTIFSVPFGRVVMGVDVAFTTGSSSDQSALVVVRVCDDGHREIIHVESDRYSFDVLAGRIIEVAQTFGAIAFIETNGGAQFLYQQVRKSIAAQPLTTSAASKIAATEILHAEISSGRWRFRPADGRLTVGMHALCADLIAFSPSEHTPDTVSALFQAVLGIRTGTARPRVQLLHFRRPWE